tara:strand:- start:30436 stop:32715 length:2280 start_codon:yes stop_codon:yes gene_type:complete
MVLNRNPDALSPFPGSVVHCESLINPRRETVMVLLHEASRSGAPILGWNIINELKIDHNVVAVVLKTGPIIAAIQSAANETVILPTATAWDGDDGARLAHELMSTYSPLYVIANSGLTSGVAVHMEECGAPVVALVHEFASDRPNTDTLNALFKHASRIVFPAQIVADDSLAAYPDLDVRKTVIQAQGSMKIPPIGKAVWAEAGRADATCGQFMGKDGRFTVLGIGSIIYRKGVDLFVSTADFLQRELGRHDIRFIWVGQTIASEMRYRRAIEAQVKKCGLEGVVEYYDEVDNLDPFYEAADLFLLSSRFDPLPNVAIDSMFQGVPVACFADAGGFSEIVSKCSLTGDLVLPYGSVSAAGRAIADLMDARRYRGELSAHIRQQALEHFDFDGYIRKITSLGHEAAEQMRQKRRDTKTILEANVFNKELCFGEQARDKTEQAVIAEYLEAIRFHWPLGSSRAKLHFGRPLPGFNPLIYDLEHPSKNGVFRDPLTDYLRKGKPQGRWAHKVIEPSDGFGASPLRTALHGHFHYPDLLEECLQSLSVNETKPDLFITTTNEGKIQKINTILEKSGWEAKEVWAVPNRGRNIFPFITDLPERLKGQYDIVCHIHGERSKYLSADRGVRWRSFAWQHLVGDREPMIDIVAAAFSNNPDVGLIFPEAPYFPGWGVNEGVATELADRIGVETPLPRHFDFPNGAMFWARPEALKPLFELKLDLSEVPVEPLPLDGTSLHALERLLPLVVEKAGYGYATTYVADVIR